MFLLKLGKKRILIQIVTTKIYRIILTIKQYLFI